MKEQEQEKRDYTIRAIAFCLIWIPFILAMLGCFAPISLPWRIALLVAAVAILGALFTVMAQHRGHMAALGAARQKILDETHGALTGLGTTVS